MLNGSLSAGGPLPAPCVHTCDISHQHLPSPLQALQACMTVLWAVLERRDSHVASQTQGLWASLQGWVVGSWGGGGGVWWWDGGMVDGGMMGGGPHDAFLPTLQRQCSLGVTLPLLALLRL